MERQQGNLKIINIIDVSGLYILYSIALLFNFSVCLTKKIASLMRMLFCSVLQVRTHMALPSVGLTSHHFFLCSLSFFKECYLFLKT